MVGEHEKQQNKRAIQGNQFFAAGQPANKFQKLSTLNSNPIRVNVNRGAASFRSPSLIQSRPSSLLKSGSFSPSKGNFFQHHAAPSRSFFDKKQTLNNNQTSAYKKEMKYPQTNPTYNPQSFRPSSHMQNFRTHIVKNTTPILNQPSSKIDVHQPKPNEGIQPSRMNTTKMNFPRNQFQNLPSRNSPYLSGPFHSNINSNSNGISEKSNLNPNIDNISTFSKTISPKNASTNQAIMKKDLIQDEKKLQKSSSEIVKPRSDTKSLLIEEEKQDPDLLNDEALLEAYNEFKSSSETRNEVEQKVDEQATAISKSLTSQCIAKTIIIKLTVISSNF